MMQGRRGFCRMQGIFLVKLPSAKGAKRLPAKGNKQKNEALDCVAGSIQMPEQKGDNLENISESMDKYIDKYRNEHNRKRRILDDFIKNLSKRKEINITSHPYKI